MLTTIQDAVKQLLPAKRKTSTSGWVSVNAVCCVHNGESADTRGRGGFIFNTDGAVTWHCFNCNFKANYTPGRHLNYKFRRLLSWLGADDATVKRLVIDAIRVRELVAPESLIEAETAEPVNFRPRPLPEGAQTFIEWGAWHKLQDYANVPLDLESAIAYVRERDIPFNRYDFYWTADTKHNYHKRVIIPFYWHGELIGHTARTFMQDVKPKYYNEHEGGYVFNVDRQPRDAKFVCVVEGPFDAMAIDGVAVLSNECSEQQADIIDSLGREVIVVPDVDRAGSKLVDQAIEYGWSVSFPVWQETCKDASEAVRRYGKLFTLQAILKGRESSRLKIELRRKKLYN